MQNAWWTSQLEPEVKERLLVQLRTVETFIRTRWNIWRWIEIFACDDCRPLAVNWASTIVRLPTRKNLPRQSRNWSYRRKYYCTNFPDFLQYRWPSELGQGRAEHCSEKQRTKPPLLQPLLPRSNLAISPDIDSRSNTSELRKDPAVEPFLASMSIVSSTLFDDFETTF